MTAPLTRGRRTKALLCLAPLAASCWGCARDVILGEHIVSSADTPSVALPAASNTDQSQAASSSSEAASSSSDATSWEHSRGFTRDHWPRSEPDSGRFFEPRDGGQWRPPRPGELPLPEPHPAASNSDFPSDFPDDEPTRGQSTNF